MAEEVGWAVSDSIRQVAHNDPENLQRVAGAPRLIEWTGERCVPWAPDVQVVYEHFHRYLWASELVAGRDVLDLASGEGFGAAILARTARTVIGVDVDERTVEHSRLNYDLPNLRFEIAAAQDLSTFADGSFGVVVAFEMIEHVAEQERVLVEIGRVLAPDGLLIMSTPDRELYDKAVGVNRFHVRELSRDELSALLSARFAQVALWGQRTVTGSTLTSVGDLEATAGPSAYFVEQVDGTWQLTGGAPEPYLIALASNVPLPSAPATSTLADPSLGLLRAAQEAGNRALATAKDELSAQLVTAQAELEAARERARSDLASARAELGMARSRITRLKARLNHDSYTISSLDAALNAANMRYRRIEESVTWQAFQTLRGRVFSICGGQESPTVERVQATIRRAGRAMKLGAPPGPRGPAIAITARRARDGTIQLSTSERPDVSIVIPLYRHAQLTRAALESIAERTPDMSYEVILVDDCADGPTKRLLGRVGGARVLVNDSNQGYLRSMRRGVEAARGRWLVLANNDIEVQPGWLAALLDCGESSPDIAIVAPKFLYPSGLLAEAGGVIWRDGTGANYGRGDDPTDCRYEYRREIDYGSAAALLVRSDFWHAVGGFDRRFEPMYYEDTDLCFEARARGLRVMYEPGARVVHVEGATAGVDPAAGHKRYQELNREKFVEKWRDRLYAEHLENGHERLWTAATLRRAPHVLVVDHRIPMWDREAGALRMRWILETLMNLGCHVSFLPDNLMPSQPYARELQRIGVEVLYGIDAYREMSRMGDSLGLVILSRPQVAGRWLPLIREHAPDARVAYDTVDLHWLREARRANVPVDGPTDVPLPATVAAMRELELAMIRATESTIVITEEERRRVLLDVPDAVVRVIPNVHEISTGAPPWQLRAGLLFVGSFEHTPNIEGALALVRDVMPLVWEQHPNLPATIVGAEPPPEVLALASTLVGVTGWVADLDALVDRAVALVAPLRYGAGMKGKVTQALAAGLPVVTTPIGAEGLEAINGEHMLIGESPEELAEHVGRLVSDPDLWRRISAAGQALAAQLCSPDVMTATMRELLHDAAAISKPESAWGSSSREPLAVPGHSKANWPGDR